MMLTLLLVSTSTLESGNVDSIVHRRGKLSGTRTEEHSKAKADALSQ